MVKFPNLILRAINTIKSDCLGVTFCQACYKLMGEDLEKTIAELAEKIFFVHFRSVRGNKMNFRETFHDDGEIDMPSVMRAYVRAGVNVPVRVDHVPTLKGENPRAAGLRQSRQTVRDRVSERNSANVGGTL